MGQQRSLAGMGGQAGSCFLLQWFALTQVLGGTGPVEQTDLAKRRITPCWLEAIVLPVWRVVDDTH